jgi:hypothetical protein
LAIRGDPDCPVWGCGANSPTVADGVVFDELDSSGTMEDTHGIKIASTIFHGAPVDLHVVGDTLSATTRDGARTPLTDAELKEMVIKLSTRAGVFELRIDDINRKQLSYWAGTPLEAVPAYKIVVNHEGQWVPICKLSASAQDPHWRTGIDYHAIVFAGDRYDATTKKVLLDIPDDTPWFNLACAGTATAKMHLMRHTRAGADLGARRGVFPTTIAERQAMLKMFTADYCGTGDVFTVDGQPLRYRDSRHWYPNTPDIEPLDPRSADALHPFAGTFEAEWDELGPICLDTPRLYSIGDIRAQCDRLGRSLPGPCGGPAGVVHWDDPVGAVDPAHPVRHAHVISANPPCPGPPRAAGAR